MSDKQQSHGEEKSSWKKPGVNEEHKSGCTEAYREGRERRRSIPGEKAGWRGTLGCERGR